MYILRRILMSFIVVFISVTAVFLVIRIIPSNIVDPKLPLEVKKEIEKSYGLDKPIHEQYCKYINDILHGDLGKSIKISKNTPVVNLIFDKMKISLQMGLWAVIISIIIGTIMGMLAAVKKGKTTDNVVNIISVLGISVPSLVIAIFLQYLFAIKFKIFPAIYSSRNFLSLSIPIIALSFWPTAQIAKYIRNELIEALNSDYILLAKSKGLNEKSILFKHALRNAVIPAIAIVGPLFVSIILGSLVVERVFAIPGLGGLMTEAVQVTDYPIIQALTLLFALIFTILYLLTDIIYSLIDPRIKLTGGNNE